MHTKHFPDASKTGRTSNDSHSAISLTLCGNATPKRSRKYFRTSSRNGGRTEMKVVSVNRPDPRLVQEFLSVLLD